MNQEIKNVNQDLMNDIKYGTNIIGGDEYLNTIMGIADTAAEMVVKTLGPYGATTFIDDGTFTYPTKDGWSVLKRLMFSDAVFNTLYKVLIQVSFDLVNKVGDGTTSAFIGATRFMHKVIDYMNEHKKFRQSEFLSDLNRISEEVITELTSSRYVRKIDVNGDFSDIKKIALTSSNGNEELATMIQEIYQKTNNPNIYVSLDSSTELSYEIQKGYKFDCNPINQKVYRNTDEGTFVLKEQTSLFAIFDHNVTYNEHDKIVAALSHYASSRTATMFIIAPHFDDIMRDVIGTSINSVLQRGQIPNIMLIQVPLSMNIHRDYLSDLVLLTSAQVFDHSKVKSFNIMVHNQTAKPDDIIEDALIKSDSFNFKEPVDIIETCVGKAIDLVIGDKYLLVQNFEHVVNEQVYKNKMAEVEELYLTMKAKANKSSTNLLKDYMDAYQHYTKLTCNLGVIKVGGKSELEKHCLKDAVDDAVLACRSAYDNGYIRGLNLATMTIIRDKLNTVIIAPNDELILNMLLEVFFEMSLNVIANKYDVEDEFNVKLSDKIKEFNPDFTISETMTAKKVLATAMDYDFGFDLVTDTFMCDDECVVINSVSTDVEVMRGMISILSTMLTSNQFLTINRTYDRVMGQQQKTEMFLESKRLQTETIVSTAIDTIKEKTGLDIGAILHIY